MDHAAVTPPRPTVSVVVPTAGRRPEALARCVQAIETAGVDEVIVVADGPAVEVPPGVTLVRHPTMRGPGAARNTGARAARGDVVAFTDDDCRPASGWARALAAQVAPGAAAGGRTINALRGNRFSEASQHIVDLVYAHYNRDPAAARFLASNNLAVPRADFLALGGFDERFRFASEDRDFCHRWRSAGNALRFVPEAVVAHAHDLDLRGFLAQHLSYGRGAARYHRARRERGPASVRDELPFHFDRALYHRTLALRPWPRAAATIGLLALWQLANAVGYALERRRVP